MSGICMVGMGSSVCIRSNLLLQWKTWLWNEIFLLRILSGASADPVVNAHWTGIWKRTLENGGDVF